MITRTSIRVGCSAVLLGITFVVFISALWGQSYRGSVRGRVQDLSGSAIAGAKVTARSAATGLTRETTTRADGAYVLAELAAGVSGESFVGRGR
jgi:hypothetical protein